VARIAALATVVMVVLAIAMKAMPV